MKQHQQIRKQNPTRHFGKLICIFLLAFFINAQHGNGQVVIAGWDVSTQPGGVGLWGTSPLAPATSDANATVGGLTRGAGVGVTGTGAARGLGGNAWNNATAALNIAANKFFTFTVKSNSGYNLSLSSINPFDYRRSGTGPPSALIEYQVDAGAYTTVATVNMPTTTSAGDHIGLTDLSGISALQNVPSTSTITFRITPFNASSATGTFYFFDVAASTANDFVINGTLTPAGPPSTQDHDITFNTVNATQMNVAWTNGDGSSRIVIINNANSFTNPVDGTSPSANTVYSGSGEQVIFNGSGSSTPVTGLTASTQYFVRVYGYNGAGAGTLYNVSTASNNPNSQTTAAFNVPAITVTGTLNAFSAVAGTPSASQTYNVSGVDMQADISVVPPPFFEVSLNGTTWTTSSGTLIVPQSVPGTVPTTQIFVRYNPVNGGANSGNITHNSTNAAQQIIAVTGFAVGPVLYATAASNYQENFDGLPSTGTFSPTGVGPYYLGAAPINATSVVGWQYGRLAGDPPNDVKFAFDNGNSQTGSAYSYGATSASDRALGSLASSAVTSNLGVVIKNTTGTTLQNVTISYTGEQWRNGGSGLPNILTFAYSLNGTGILSGTYTPVAALDFTSPISSSPTGAALNGNVAPNRTAKSASFTLNGNWLPENLLVLKWDDFREGNGNDGLSIDDFSFSATPPATPVTQDNTISFSNVLTTSMTAQWLNGDGANHLVIMNTSNTFTAPTDGSSPTANTVYGGGQQVVYSGNGNSVNVTNLIAGTIYYFHVYGYNGIGTSTKYNTTDATQNPNSQSTAAPSQATQLAILSVNGGVNPVVNQAFSVVVQAQDNGLSPQNVAVNTTVSLDVFIGTPGSLSSGNVTGVITAGTNQVTITGVKYNVAENAVQLEASVTSGDPLSNGQSATFDVLQAATTLQFGSVPASGIKNVIVGTITVEARRPNTTIDPNYNGPITIAVSPSGPMSGTLTQNAVAGVATFNDIQFNAAGTYPVIATASGLTTSTSTGIIITEPPVMHELVIPQYIGSKTTPGVNGTNINRTPIAVCISIDNLVPNTTYNLAAGLGLTTDANTVLGAGNIWAGTQFLGQDTTGPFTTDANGFSGPVWLYIQPTGNETRFDAGQVHNLRVAYSTSAFPANTSSVVPNFISTATITALDIATTARTVSTADDGAFLKGSSVPCISGKYVLVYDNIAGTGQPLFSYQARNMVPTNSSQTDLPTIINDIYRQGGTSTVGDYVAVIPIGANNSSGVRRIELRNSNNSFFNAATDPDGDWPGGASFTTITRRSVGTILPTDAQFNSVSVTTTSTPVTCSAANSGTATANATGVGTVTYAWSTTPIQTTSTATNLTAGTYTVTVSDDNGCTATSVATVGQPAASTITAHGPTTFCSGGSVVLSAGNGSSYSWSPTLETTQSITVSTAGTYTVTVDDGTGCTLTSAPVTVVVNTFGLNGTIYSESMGNGVTGQNILISNYSGWQNSAPITYTSTSASQTDVRATTPSTGYAGNSGGANIFYTTSVPVARNFVISGINTLGYSNIALTFGLKRESGTTADLFVVEYSVDGTTFTPLTITQPPTTSWTLVTASGAIPATANLRLRFSKSSASFRLDDVKLTGAVSSVEISASSLNLCPGSSVTLTSNFPGVNANLWSPNSETTQTIVVNTAGTYSVTATDANGCSSASAPVTVVDVPAPSVTTTPTDATCFGQNNGSAVANASSGTSPYTYSWSTSPVQTTATASSLAAGNYTVSVTDVNGCTGTSSATIAEPPAVVISNINPGSSCPGGSVVITGTHLLGATSVSFNGTNASFTIISDVEIDATVPSGATTGNVTVTNGSGCTGTSGSAFTVSSCGVTLNICMYIECFYNLGSGPGLMDNGGSGGFMFVTTIDPNTGLPVTTPLPASPVGGTISKPTHPSNNIEFNDVDWVKVGIYSGGTCGASGSEIPMTLVSERTGLLQTNGALSVEFPTSGVDGVPPGSYWILLNQQNTVPTWSSVLVTISGSSVSYSFCSSVSQAFSDNQVVTPDNLYAAIHSGDVNQDGGVDGSDFLSLDPFIQEGAGGYSQGDLNGDGAVDGTDFLCLDLSIQNGIGVAPPLCP